MCRLGSSDVDTRKASSQSDRVSKLSFSKIEGRSTMIQSYTSRADSSASCKRSGSRSALDEVSGAARTSIPCELTTSDDQSGWPESSIAFSASSKENSWPIFRKNATEPLVMSKSASRIFLPDCPKTKAVWQASVEAPEPGFELENTTSRPRPASELVDGLRKRIIRTS